MADDSLGAELKNTKLKALYWTEALRAGALPKTLQLPDLVPRLPGSRSPTQGCQGAQEWPRSPPARNISLTWRLSPLAYYFDFANVQTVLGRQNHRWISVFFYRAYLIVDVTGRDLYPIFHL